jgi:trigger factor
MPYGQEGRQAIVYRLSASDGEQRALKVFKPRYRSPGLVSLAERLEGDVPEELAQTRANSMTRDFFENLEERNITLAEYVDATGASPEKIQADIAEQAAVLVREELALEALFRMQGLEVTDADVTEAIVSMSGGDEVQAERMRESLTENGVLPLVREQLVHQKALGWLLDAVTVVEEEPS